MSKRKHRKDLLSFGFSKGNNLKMYQEKNFFYKKQFLITAASQTIATYPTNKPKRYYKLVDITHFHEWVVEDRASKN